MSDFEVDVWTSVEKTFSSVLVLKIVDAVVVAVATGAAKIVVFVLVKAEIVMPGVDIFSIAVIAWFVSDFG